MRFASFTSFMALVAATNVVVADSKEPSLLRGMQDTNECKQVDTVPDFDLETYVSKPWYIHQQAVIEFNPIEQNYCARAKYSIRDSPNLFGYTVDVDNYAQNVNGTEFGGPLCAFQDDDTLSKLNVAPCFLPKNLAGPYWVVAYKEEPEDYTEEADGEIRGYALISGGQPTIPSGDNGGCKTGDGVNDSGLWILSRRRERDEDMISEVRRIAVEKGFDLSVLNDVDQAGCVYPEDEKDLDNIGEEEK